MKKLLVVIALLATTIPSVAASPPPPPAFDTDSTRYRTGDIVTITLENHTRADLTMENPWVIENLRTGATKSIYNWPEDQLVVHAGQSRTWAWEQNDGGCYGQCENVHHGEPVGAGRYVAIAQTSAGELRATFQIGEYFTLGFTSRPNIEFVVYVNRPDDVAAMRTEAEKTDQGEKQIVSGIVRRGKSYNPDWNFTMGPSSVVLGDMFIEVCDGSPYYVQRNRSEWIGHRWCPWSSYVEKVGR